MKIYVYRVGNELVEFEKEPSSSMIEKNRMVFDRKETEKRNNFFSLISSVSECLVDELLEDPTNEFRKNYLSKYWYDILIEELNRELSDES